MADEVFPVPEQGANGLPFKRTYRMILAFDGTAYHGWQRQPNGISVQQVVEEKLGRLFGGMDIRIQGSSRTDAGVHALGMCASFSASGSPYIPDWKILKAMNRLLPSDIRLKSVEIVPDSFNARFSAEGKSYVYVIRTGEPDPFTSRYSWLLPDFTETAAVAEALRSLQGIHDFRTFATDSSGREDTVRNILKAEIYETGEYKCIQFLGTGFLYKMVRSMVGTLAEVGRGKLNPAEIGRMLAAKDRLAARDTAPACGLFLMKVFYTPGEWDLWHYRGLPFRGEEGTKI